MSPNMNDEELDRRIGALPLAPLPPFLAARVRERAAAAFVRGERPPSRLASVGTAVAVVSAIAVYLTWAIDFLGALARS
jgi:hypothetical protein